MVSAQRYGICTNGSCLAELVRSTHVRTGCLRAACVLLACCLLPVRTVYSCSTSRDSVHRWTGVHGLFAHHMPLSCMVPLLQLVVLVLSIVHGLVTNRVTRVTLSLHRTLHSMPKPVCIWKTTCIRRALDRYLDGP